MARVADLDFRGFLDAAARGRPGGDEGDGHAYAYVSDRRTRQAFGKVRPVELAVAATVRLFKNVGKSELLGQAVKVGPRQFPRVHALAVECARTLGIPTPTLYVVNSPYLNAATYGTSDDAFVMVHSALVDHMSDDELRAVIGHECGHIHNDHVVYLTALHYLTNLAGLFVKWIVAPAVLSLRAWNRRAEITCDRAALLCTRDLDATTRALTKLALGSQKLYDELDLETFLEQYHESQASVGRFGELLASHPWLPKRVLALRAFAESALFRRHAGLGDDGLGMPAVDEKVHGILKVVG